VDDGSPCEVDVVLGVGCPVGSDVEIHGDLVITIIIDPSSNIVIQVIATIKLKPAFSSEKVIFYNAFKIVI
jgi:hypothetical protein